MKKWVVLAVVLAVGGFGVYIYRQWTQPVTYFSGAEKKVFVASGSTLEELTHNLLSDSIITDETAFRILCDQKHFSTPRPGMYRISANMSANELVNKLRSGDQDPVRVVIQSVRTPEELAGMVGRQLEADSTLLIRAFHDQKLADSLGFNEHTFRTMFIPNTYEFWWNTDAQQFVRRMAEEYRKVWNDDRKEKAAQLGLSASEVVTLASIVHAETAKRDEAPKVAGLYLNRIRIGMALQADPTLIWAAGDFSIKRVLNVHKTIDSPYNTYLYPGLPPGPIRYPELNYIDAVLNADTHAYLYMCAKADFSGYHHFSSSYEQHLQYAREYQRAISNR